MFIIQIPIVINFTSLFWGEDSYKNVNIITVCYSVMKPFSNCLFQVVHLPSYVESLANVMSEVEPGPVEPAVLISIERIVVYLIKQFPKLPFQYHPFAIRAFHKVIIKKVLGAL